MAGIVVNFVLGKLADAAIKEVLFLWVVPEKVEKVKEELVRIQAFLKDADSSPVKDERQRNWVKEVRDVAYSIEDVIDTALMLKEDTPPEKLPKKMEISQSSCFPCKTSAVKKLFRKSKNIPVLHELGNEIDSILAKMKDIDESRARYRINNIGEGSGGTGSRPPTSTKPIVVPGIYDPIVIGIDEDIVNILMLLLDANTTRRSVVSIVGTGGLGKTTLALKAYKRIVTKRDVDKKVWVTVSKEFKLIDLLKDIVKQFRTIEPIEREDEKYFLTALHECCLGKKYLIVLDDVWTTGLWTQVEQVLPDENNGSRVLITTRSLDVAKQADPLSQPYQLKFLTPESSLELLLKKALPHYFTKDYPDDLVKLGKKFVKKCGGLPLPLAVLGGLLSKRSDYNAWDNIMRTMNWGVDGEQCIGILASSFEDLPLSHKYCFMYFAMFPEDFQIDAKGLVRMWVAEGLIPKLQNRTLEETGEGFLDELAQRCMIQVSSRSFDGSIGYCRIHDLLRDLAIEKAKEDNFIMVSSVDDMTSCYSARRLAVHHSNCGELTKYASKNLRSLVCFGPPPDCSKQRLLKVLRTKSPNRMNVKGLEGLTQLRYVELKNWKYEKVEYFNRFLCSMKFLQTLDLRDSGKIECIPDCFWHIKTLRHVMLPFPHIDGLPPSIDHRNLQTLSRVKSRTSWSTEDTPNLPNLRLLDIEIVEGLSWEMVAGLLDTIKYLKGLVLWNYYDSFKVPNMSAFPFYPYLQFLFLRRIYDDESLSSLCTNMFPQHLIELYVYSSELNNDPIPVLEKLRNLKTLVINDLKYHKRQMRFSDQGFAQLEKLELEFIRNLEELNIQDGAMPLIKEISLRRLKLRVPLNIRYIPFLDSWS